MRGYTILPMTGLDQDLADWNDFKNKFGSKEYRPTTTLSTKKLESVIDRFESFCQTYHIDHTKYRIIDPCEFHRLETFQFDFRSSLEDGEPLIQMHSVIFGRTGQILQSVIDLGR
jgi:hypothetical protein